MYNVGCCGCRPKARDVSRVVQPQSVQIVLIRSLEALSKETKHTKIHCRKCVCMYVCMYVQYASKKIPVSVPLNRRFFLNERKTNGYQTDFDW